ncbi:MAG: hypothetical protein JO168_09655 [Solirubrobacterales bacterium]|nr:hypothetical protein [Solirubrobacterales bacterium]
MKAEMLSGGEAIVHSLLRARVDTVFGIPGVQTYALYDALARAQDRLRVVTPRHEQAAGYMAFGYARSTGRPGVFSVVPGPGVLNAGAALCTAFGASTPVLCVTSQVPSPYIGSGLGHLHELPDQLATLRTITKWAQRIEHPAQAPGIVAEALRRATSGRPRPVAVEMPWDVLEARAPVSLDVQPVGEPVPDPDPDAVDRVADALATAHNPMIMAGGGAQHAAEEVRALAERVQAPVVPFRSGRGILTDEHHLGFTCASGFERWHQTDVVLGIGTRMELMWFRWPDRRPGLRVLTVDVDPTQPLRLGAEHAITADAAAGTRALVAALDRHGRRRPSRAEEFTRIKAAVGERINEIQPHAALLAAIRAVLPRDGFLVEEICQCGFTSYFAFPVYSPRSFVSGGHQGTLGFGFPTALGVKVANPTAPVVAITGDGGFGFGLQELATAAQEKIAVVTVLFDNAAYGNVLRDQHRLFNGREIGARLKNPNWITLAESFGVAARTTAPTPDGLASTLDWALALDAPALVVVPVDARQERSPWPLLMPASRTAA